jgi:predicted nicotinamide N-methyase
MSQSRNFEQFLKIGFESSTGEFKAKTIKEIALETIQNHRKIVNPEVILIGDEKFIILPHVFNPNISPSGAVVQNWIEQNKHLFQGKIMLDVGCGSGIPTCQFALLEAKKVFATDISPPARLNTILNTNLHLLSRKIEIATDYTNVPAIDIIFANLPLSNKKPKDELERGFYDDGLESTSGLISDFESRPIFANSTLYLTIFDIDTNWFKSRLKTSKTELEYSQRSMGILIHILKITHN